VLLEKNTVVLNYVHIPTQVVTILSLLKNDITKLRYLIICIFQKNV